MFEYTDYMIEFLIFLFVIDTILFLTSKIKIAIYTANIVILIFLFIYFRIEYRIVELSLPLVGTIKTQADQAEKYAGKISQIAKNVTDDGEKLTVILSQAKIFQSQLSELAYKNEEASSRLAAINNLLDSSSKTEQNLSALSNLYSEIILAQSDSWPAYAHLRELEVDLSFSYAKLAGDAANQIQRHAEDTMFGTTIRWEKFNIEPDKLWGYQLEDIYNDFRFRNDVDSPNLKVGLIQYFSNRNDLNEDYKLSFLAEIIRHDDSIKAIAYAGVNFARISNQDYRALATSAILEWYEKHILEEEKPSYSGFLDKFVLMPNPFPQ